MSAYLIVDIDIRDAKRYETYRRDVAALIARHGGQYLVRGGEFEIIEGDWHPTRLVLLQFPDRKAIHAFLDDSDYKSLADLRHAVAKSHLVAVDGV